MDGIFSDEEIKASEATEAEEPQEEPVEEGDDRPRDEHGRFVAKEPEEEEKPAEGKPPEGHVPQGALHAEREKRKASDQRASTLEAELKKAQDQLGAIAQLRQAALARQAPAPATPSEDDPTGIQHLTQRLSAVEQGQTQIQTRQELDSLREAENAQIGALVGHAEAAYRQQQPDYDEAIAHVINARAQELALYGMSQMDIRTTLANEAADIARSAISQGRDPAELAYQIAHSRGYRPQAQGKAASTVAAVGAAKSAQGTSLGSSGGSSATQLSAESIAGMSEAEFMALYDTPNGRALIDAAMGGQA